MAYKNNVRVYFRRGGSQEYYNAFWSSFKWGISIHKRVGKGNMRGNKAIAKHSWNDLRDKRNGKPMEAF